TMRMVFRMVNSPGQPRAAADPALPYRAAAGGCVAVKGHLAEKDGGYPQFVRFFPQRALAFSPGALWISQSLPGRQASGRVLKGGMFWVFR
ncbi:MAG TPA: hypothetical protein PK794_09280, partial [Armatimonadota bacterium]|nr:hypothetical protein [Armatimonadota bacterium]